MSATSTCLLSTAYWAPVQWFTKIVSHSQVLIEQFETFPKQSFRNRCALYGPNCVQTLQVPILKSDTHNPMTRDIRIAYQTPWQKNHFNTIRSLYKSSPFFDYYADDILPFYERRFDFLLDYNRAILEVCLKWLKMPDNTALTADYVHTPDCPDYRNTIHPKQSHQSADPHFAPQPYTQVFGERFGLIPNLSIIDLVMNCGPEALQVLRESCEKGRS